MGILSTESDRVVERFLMIFYFDHQFRFEEVGGFGAFLRSVAVRFASSNNGRSKNKKPSLPLWKTKKSTRKK